MVASGVLRPGDRLPTVRQLAADLGINRNTAAKAYGLLREEGLIVTRSGGGSHVASNVRRMSAKESRVRLRGAVQRLAHETDQLGIEPTTVLDEVRRALGHRTG